MRADKAPATQTINNDFKPPGPDVREPSYCPFVSSKGPIRERARREGRVLTSAFLRAMLRIWPVLLILLGAMAAAADLPPPARSGSVGTLVQDGSRLPEIWLAQQYAPQQDGQAGATSGSLAVIFPDIGEPYRSVFAQIIEGIRESARVPVHVHPVRADTDRAILNGVLRRNGTRGLIALGRQGMRAASAIDLEIPVVVGGVLSVPKEEVEVLNAITLTPDPALLFARLKSMVPDVRRVTVIYDPRQNDWVIRLAREAARNLGLELVAHEARDMAAAARLYEAAFAASDGRRDAIWLPQDTTTVDETTILPLVLREAWTRGVPILSSSFVHAKRGALFALYPDNVELGRALAASAQAAMRGGPPRRGALPLREVRIAVNLRTASHLGLHFNHQQQRSFDLTFPEP